MGTRYDEEERKRREAAMAALQRGGPDAQNLINGMGDEQKRAQAQASFDVLSARKRAEEALTGGEDTALRLIRGMATPEKRDRALDAYTQMTRDRKSPLYNPNARTYSQIQSAWKKEEEETRAREEGVRAAARNAAQVTDAYRRMKADDDAYRAKESAVTAATGAPLTAGGALGMLGRIGEIQDDGARADTLGAFLSNMGNVRSPYYNPYYGGSTNEYAQKIFGQTSFSQEWVDENAGLSAYLIRDEFTGDVKKPGASATEMQNKAYAWHVIAKDIGVTQAAQEEAASLYEEAARAGASGYFDADWVEEIDWKDYPTLKKMLDGAAEKNPLRLSDAVPFSLEALYGAAYAGENGIEVLDARDYLTLAGNWASARARDERKAAWEEEQRAQLGGVEGFLYDNLGVGKKEYTDEDDARMREKQKAAPGEAQEEATLGDAQEKATSGEAQEEATLGEAQEDAAAGGTQGAADREEGTDEETQAPQASGTEPTGSESADAAARAALGTESTAGEIERETGYAPDEAQKAGDDSGKVNFWALSQAAQAALGAESTADEIEREAGYAPDEAQKAGDDSGKVNFWALSQAAQAERIANMTYEDKNRALQQGDYSFVENEDDRRAMHDIDAQIADIQTQLAVMEGTDDLGGLTMPAWLAKQDGLMRDIEKLEIRKAQIAFPDPNAQIPDASDQNMRPPDGWSYGQGLVNQRLTKEQEILDQADAQIADLQGQLSRGEIDAKTYNERYFAIDQQSRREKEHIAREISIIWMPMPTDEETRALRGGAARERLGLLYEKEIAIADGETGRVKEINARLTEMGYSTEWPEVDAAAEAARAQRMERVRSLDTDEVCEMLGYAPGTALTEADYQKAAEISTGWWETGEGLQAVGNWFLRVLAKDTVKKETGVSEAEALLRGEAVNDPDVYAKIAKDAAERVIAQTEGQPNADQYRDLMLGASILPATVGGAAKAGETILKAPTWTATHLTWAALNLSAGEELTLEQQRALHPGLFNSWVGGNEALNKWSITNRMTFGVGGVDPGLAEYEDIMAEVMLNYALSGMGSKVGNWRAKLYMSKFPGIEKTPKVLAEAYRMYEGTTKTITGTGFLLRGYMSNATEAAADGATSGQQALFGVLGATGSAVIENQNDIFRAMGFDAGDAAKGMAAYGKTIRYDEAKGYKLLGSVIFHSALDEALEELEESPVSGALKYGIYGREQGMPVFGAGGIIDPAGAFQSAAQGGLVGGIMGAGAYVMNDGGTIFQTKAENQAEALDAAAPELDAQTVPWAAMSLGSEMTSETTKKIAMQVMDTIAEGGHIDETMKNALVDGFTGDVAKTMADETAAPAIQEATDAQTALEKGMRYVGGVAQRVQAVTQEVAAWEGAITGELDERKESEYKQLIAEQTRLIKEQESGEANLQLQKSKAVEAEATATQAQSVATEMRPELAQGIKEIFTTAQTLPPQERATAGRIFMAAVKANPQDPRKAISTALQGVRELAGIQATQGTGAAVTAISAARETGTSEQAGMQTSSAAETKNGIMDPGEDVFFGDENAEVVDVSAQERMLADIVEKWDAGTELTAADVRELLGEDMTETVRKWLHNRNDKGKAKGTNVDREALTAFIRADKRSVQEGSAQAKEFHAEADGREIPIMQPQAIEGERQRKEGETLRAYLKRTLFGGGTEIVEQNEDTGVEIVVKGRSVGESVSQQARHGVPQNVQQAALENIPQLLKSAVYIGSHEDYSGNAKDVHYFANAMQIEGETRRIIFQVKEDSKKKNRLYVETVEIVGDNKTGDPGSHTPSQRDDGDGIALTPGIPRVGESPDTISIADLLADYNREHIKKYPLWLRAKARETQGVQVRNSPPTASAAAKAEAGTAKAAAKTGTGQKKGELKGASREAEGRLGASDLKNRRAVPREQSLRGASEIVKDLQKVFRGVTVRPQSADTRINDAGGDYKPGSGSIRVVGTGNVQVLVHEIGHKIAMRNGLINDIQRDAKGRLISCEVRADARKAMDAMVENLPEDFKAFYRKPDGSWDEREMHAEALAVFWERWLESEEAARDFAGGLYDDIVKGMTKRELAAMEQAREDWNRLQRAELAQRIATDIKTRSETEVKRGGLSPVDYILDAVFDENYAYMKYDEVALASVKGDATKKEWKQARRSASKNGQMMMDANDRAYLKAQALGKVKGTADFATRSRAIGPDGLDVYFEAEDGTREKVLTEAQALSKIPNTTEARAEFNAYCALWQEIETREAGRARKARREARLEAEVEEKRRALDGAKAADERAKKELGRAKKSRDAKWQAEANERLNQTGKDAAKARGELEAATDALEKSRLTGIGQQSDEVYMRQYASVPDAEIVRQREALKAKHPEYDEAFQALVKTRQAMMEAWIIKTGVAGMSLEDYRTKVIKARPHYLPTRVTNTLDVQEHTQAGTLVKSERKINRAQGGDQTIQDFAQGIYDETAGMIRAFREMDLKRTMARAYDTYDGYGAFLREITDVSAENVSAVNRLVRERIRADGTFDGSGMGELYDVMLSMGTSQEAGRVMTVTEADGRERQFEIVNQALYNAMARQMTPRDTLSDAKFLKGLQKATDVFRETTTLKNPRFILKNMMRDLSTVLITGNHQNMQDAVNSWMQGMRAIYEYQMNGKITDERLLRYAALGGLGGDSYMHGEKGEKAFFEEIFSETNWDEKKLKGFAERMAKQGVQVIANLNDIVEGAQRYAQFIEGLNAGQPDIQAFNRAMENTTDFSKHGSSQWVRNVGKVMYFFNAGLQGTYDVIHAMQEGKFDPKRSRAQLTRGLMQAAVLPLLQALLRMTWKDEDRDKYDALEENVKAENYVAGFIGKNAILIPRGQSPLFAVGDLLGRRIADGMLEERRKGGDWKSYLRHEAGDDVADGLFGILDSMNPIESGLFSPLIGITFNRNAFGDEIVPDYMKNWQKQDQYDDYTSTVAVWLGKLGIMSPKQIHYLIDQQFGIVGDTLLNLTTPAKGYTDGLEGFGRLLAQSTVGGFYRGVNVKAAAYDDFQYYKEQFEDGLLDTYKRCDGDRETMNSWVSKALSPREFAKAMNDAEKIGDYLKETQSAIYKLNDKIRKSPDDARAEAWERQAALLALEACQVGESWMRRYQEGDLNVGVKVPMGK